jgi:hypothetical protein
MLNKGTEHYPILPGCLLFQKLNFKKTSFLRKSKIMVLQIWGFIQVNPEKNKKCKPPVKQQNWND